jgi:hypothetical protein
MKTNPETTRYWLQHLEALKSSGLSRRAYCEAHQLKLSTLDYWRQKQYRSEASPGKINQTGWVPLRVSEENADSEIVLCIGRIRVEVKSGFDRTLLAELQG